MKILMRLLMLISSSTYAAEDWLCTEESSQRSNDVVKACGVGMGFTEQEARKDAFNTAYAEFKALCDVSSDCQNHAVIATPKRTTCQLDGQIYKCYRLVEYRISNVLAQVHEARQRRKIEEANMSPLNQFFAQHGPQALMERYQSQPNN